MKPAPRPLRSPAGPRLGEVAATLSIAALLAWSLWRMWRWLWPHVRGDLPGSGADFAVYCAAGATAAAGGDPYVARAIGGALTYNYPPLLLPLFHAWCGDAAPPPSLYLVPYAIAAALAAWLVGVGGDLRQRVVAAAIVLGGFNALGFTLFTGNFAIAELLLCALAAALLLCGRAPGAGAALGTAASIKLMPVTLLLALAPWPPDRRRLVAILAAGAAAFATVLALSVAYAPGLTASYLRQLAGLHPGQHAPLQEMNAGYPSLYGLVRGWIDPPLAAAVAAVASAVLVLPAALHAWRTARATGATGQDRLAAVMLLWIALVIVMPRLNFYGFVLAVIPVAVLARNIPPLHQVLVAVQAVAGLFLLTRLPRELRTSLAVAVHGQWLLLAVLYVHLLLVLVLRRARRVSVAAQA